MCLFLFQAMSAVCEYFKSLDTKAQGLYTKKLTFLHVRNLMFYQIHILCQRMTEKVIQLIGLMFNLATSTTSYSVPQVCCLYCFSSLVWFSSVTKHFNGTCLCAYLLIRNTENYSNYRSRVT